MRNNYVIMCFYIAANVHIVVMQDCRCKEMSQCYKNMLNTLLNENEEPCVEHAAIGHSAITIFLKALTQFCGDYISVNNASLSYQNRNLYEAILGIPDENSTVINSKPVIILEAGQDAGIEPVTFALFVIEQLIACKEHHYMLENARWVILPSTNPDGREYARSTIATWKKNLRPSEDDNSMGVDITRNFDDSFNDCDRVANGFSPQYPGKKPLSENETIFITSIVNKYKSKLRAYVSIRRDGHALMYPFASTNTSRTNTSKLITKAHEIVAKINHKVSFVQILANSSIFDMNRKPRCGHSVDYVYNKYGHPYAYELRVFLETDQHLMTKFEALPHGYETTLRTGYLFVIKELYNAIVAEHKLKTTNKQSKRFT